MRLVAAEFRKLLSTRTWIFLLLGAVAFTALVVSLTIGFAGREGSPVPTPDQPGIQPIVLSSAAASVVFIVVLGTIGMTQEYRHRTATPTYLTTPHRGAVVAAKLITYLIVGVVFAAVSTVVVLAIATPWIAAKGGHLTLGDGHGAVLLGAAVACAIYGLVGVGVGALIRNQIGAVVGVTAYLFVLEPILRGIPATSGVYKWLPGGAQEAMTATTSGTDVLGRWPGALLLLAYGLVAAVLGWLVSVRRDVT